MQVRIVFKLIFVDNRPAPILFYGEYFQYSTRHTENNIDGQSINIPEPGIDMFSVHRHFRSNGTRMGDVLPLQNIQQIVQLIPKFGAVADPAFTMNNSAEIGREYYLNNFADKETFHAILSYQ
jgi:hypothetical protein